MLCIPSLQCKWNGLCGLVIWRKPSSLLAGFSELASLQRSLPIRFSEQICDSKIHDLPFLAGSWKLLLYLTVLLVSVSLLATSRTRQQRTTYARCMRVFQERTWEKNEKLRQRVLEMAEKKCSSNQLALAWVHHKGQERKNLDSNIDAVQVSLTDEEIAELEAAVPTEEIAGELYNAGLFHTTWRYAQSPLLSSWKQSS